MSDLGDIAPDRFAVAADGLPSSDAVLELIDAAKYVLTHIDPGAENDGKLMKAMLCLKVAIRRAERALAEALPKPPTDPRYLATLDALRAGVQPMPPNGRARMREAMLAVLDDASPTAAVWLDRPTHTGFWWVVTSSGSPEPCRVEFWPHDPAHFNVTWLGSECESSDIEITATGIPHRWLPMGAAPAASPDPHGYARAQREGRVVATEAAPGDW